MFSGASNFTNGVDLTFLIILGISFIFLIGLTATMIAFAVKFNKKRHPKAVQFEDKMILEVAWIAVPTVLVLLMFYYGYVNFITERTPPKDAMVINVTGKMWYWTFDHGNGKIKKDTLVVPLGKAVNLSMTSPDVTHSFYVPAFRIKEDVVPGQTTHLWFIPQQVGCFDIFCAEFCGLRHSYMIGIIKVVEEKEYANWLAKLPVTDLNSIPKGLVLMDKNRCLGCHSQDGSELIGPSFVNFYGHERTVLVDGKEEIIKVDSSYIRNSILSPNAQIVKGYKSGLMKPYQGVISDKDINEIIKYFKTKSEKKN